MDLLAAGYGGCERAPLSGKPTRKTPKPFRLSATGPVLRVPSNVAPKAGRPRETYWFLAVVAVKTAVLT
jgi:hypothetical protein